MDTNNKKTLNQFLSTQKDIDSNAKSTIKALFAWLDETHAVDCSLMAAMIAYFGGWSTFTVQYRVLLDQLPRNKRILFRSRIQNQYFYEENKALILDFLKDYQTKQSTDTVADVDMASLISDLPIMKASGFTHDQVKSFLEHDSPRSLHGFEEFAGNMTITTALWISSEFVGFCHHHFTYLSKSERGRHPSLGWR